MSDKSECKHLEEENIIQDYSLDEKGYNINGCCGGCYIITELKYCPFCGEKVGYNDTVCSSCGSNLD